MKVCGGGAFTMADDTICMETHITCVKLTKFYGSDSGRHGVFTIADDTICTETTLHVSSSCWAARYDTGLLIELMQKGAFPPFCFCEIHED